MQEVPYEADAVENDNFGTAGRFIHRRGIYPYLVVNHIGGNKDVVVDTKFLSIFCRARLMSSMVTR